MKLQKALNLILASLTIVLLQSCGGARLHSKKINGVPSNQTWFEKDAYDASKVTSLVKKDGKDYKILLLADIQIDKIGFKGRKHAFNLIDQLVAKTNPDLIITLGDNTQGNYSDKMALKLSEHLSKFNIPWAVTLGNHDSEGRRGRPWYGNLYENAENSLFKYGPSNIHGVGNYAIHLKDESGKILYSFVMLDSNEYREYESGAGYDFIYQDQINWYQWEVEGVSKTQYGNYDPEIGHVVPSMSFFHIPLLEFSDAAEAVKNGTIKASEIAGKNNEGVAAAKINSGLFNVMLDLKSTTHVFCGHDHINNLSVNWKGIQLSYGLKTGETSYFDEKMQGGTLLTLSTVKDQKDKDSIKTKIDYLYITK